MMVYDSMGINLDFDITEFMLGYTLFLFHHSGKISNCMAAIVLHNTVHKYISINVIMHQVIELCSSAQTTEHI